MREEGLYYWKDTCPQLSDTCTCILTSSSLQCLGQTKFGSLQKTWPVQNNMTYYNIIVHCIYVPAAFLTHPDTTATRVLMCTCTCSVTCTCTYCDTQSPNGPLRHDITGLQTRVVFSTHSGWVVTEGSVAKDSIEECLHLGHLFLWGKYQISASSVMALMDDEFMLCYQLVLGTYKILDDDLTQTMLCHQLHVVLGASEMSSQEVGPPFGRSCPPS